MSKATPNNSIDDNGYGYYCDPDIYTNHDILRPRNKYQPYYAFKISIEPIYENTENDEENDMLYINKTEPNIILMEKINMYKSMFEYGCIIIGTITMTTMLIEYNII